MIFIPLSLPPFPKRKESKPNCVNSFPFGKGGFNFVKYG